MAGYTLKGASGRAYTVGLKNPQIFHNCRLCSAMKGYSNVEIIANPLVSAVSRAIDAKILLELD